MQHRSPARFAMALALLAPAAARAQVNELPHELEGIGIDEKPGAVPSKELLFRNQDGKQVKLGDYFDGQHPVVLVLAYYQCPMLCSMVLNGITDGLKGLAGDSGWTAGDRFKVLTISFDARDTSEKAQDKRANQLESYGQKVPAAGWDFLVGDPATVKQLADTVGFHYRWDEKQKQFAHAAGAFFFTPDGRLSRTLYGIQFPSKSVRLALVEATEGKLGNTWDKVILFCFHYDPAARGYVLFARRLMTAGGVVTMFAIGGLLYFLFRSPRTRQPLPDSMNQLAQKSGPGAGKPLPAPTERAV